MPQILALTCPVCGAPLARDSDQCSFCGTIVFIKPDAPRLNTANLNRAVVQEHIADFRRRVRANQYDEEAHYGLGVAYYNLGLYDAAVDELTVAARLMPENPDIQVQLAVVLREMSRLGDASAKEQLPSRLAATLRLDPSNTSALVMQTELLAERGQIDRAHEVARQLTQVDLRKGYEAANRLDAIEAATLVQQKNWAAARPLIQSLPDEMAKPIITQYISQFPLPLTLIDSERQRRQQGILTISTVVIILACCVLAAIIPKSSPAVVAVSLLVLAVVLFWAAIAGFRANRSRQTIDGALILSATDIGSLFQLADTLFKYQRGELITPEQARSKQKAAWGKAPRNR